MRDDLIRTIRKPLPEIPALRERMTIDEYEALVMRLETRIADLEAAGKVLLDAVRGEGAVTVQQVNQAAAVVTKSTD